MTHYFAATTMKWEVTSSNPYHPEGPYDVDSCEFLLAVPARKLQSYDIRPALTA